MTILQSNSHCINKNHICFEDIERLINIPWIQQLKVIPWHLNISAIDNLSSLHCTGRHNTGMYQTQMQYVPMEKSVNMECEINNMHWVPTISWYQFVLTHPLKIIK
jgi:hypothetical protein